MRRCVYLTLLTALMWQWQTAPSFGQDVATAGRQVVKKVLPNYPPLAKRMGLGGVVKVEVVIDPKGSVKSTKVVGGSPVLANAAEDAIRRWQFQPGPDTNTQIVEFKFDPQN
jgi:TonB family protein